MSVNNKIKIRRGNNIDLPAGGTESGELRYSIDTKELYIDDGSLNIKIGGDPYAFPVSTATQSALNGKQASGTYSTDIHVNITALNAVAGTNTGDETLTSIKTKLGAATSVSDGYLKYQDWNTFNSKEPAITKNTAFNKNFGSTAGTVLEGRTFGTAAGSSVGDFIQNQNSAAQTANMWIDGNIKSANITMPITGYALIGENYFYRYDGTTMGLNGNFGTSGAATFASTVNSTGFLLNGNNLTSSLTTNYIPKWNGSNFVNSLISDNGDKLSIVGGAGVLSYFQSSNGYTPFTFSSDRGATKGSLSADNGNIFIGRLNPNGLSALDDIIIGNNGEVKINASTPSTSPTNGALVVGGGIGAGGKVYATGFATSTGTSSQYLMADGSVSTSVGVNQTQTTVNGSTSGSMVCSMPFQTGSYKKVIIYLTNLVGTAEYIFPVQFVGGASKRIITTNVTAGTSGSFPDDRVNITATSGNGTITIEGY